MFNTMKINKFWAILFCGIVIIWTNSSILYGQEKFLLTESEMADYELKKQSPCHFPIADGDKIHYGIEQKWHIVGRDERENIFISYFEFNTEPEAIQGTAYAATKGNAVPYIWNSFTGSIVGDGSWVATSDGAIYFARGNVGIQIFKPVNFEQKDRQALISISNKLLIKIEANLSPKVLSFEEAARQKQIPMDDYQTITDPVVNSETMNGFSLHSVWDSKWLINSESLAMGIRKEWKTDQEEITGIDLCKFDSDQHTLKACELMSQNTWLFERCFHLDDLDSLKKIIEKWRQFGIDMNISVVGFKGNMAAHIYQFDPAGIDTEFFYSVVEKVAEQISNF